MATIKKKKIISPYFNKKTMKTVSLNIKERLLAEGLINGFKGSMALSAKLIDDIKNIAIFAEEKEAIGFTLIKNDEGQVTSATWNDEKSGEKSIELSEETFDYLAAEIKKKDDSGEISIVEAPIFISLSNKLK